MPTWEKQSSKQDLCPVVCSEVVELNRFTHVNKNLTKLPQDTRIQLDLSCQRAERCCFCVLELNEFKDWQ